MKFLPLHIKTSLLASLFSLTALAVGLLAVSVNIGRQAQAEQKELATLQAENLADQLAANRSRYDADDLKNLANVVSGSRPNLLTVRLWQIENGRLVETVSSDDSLPPEELSGEQQAAILNGSGAATIKTLPDDFSGNADGATNGARGDSYYRVFAPIVEQGRATGAVEAVERLDTIPAIAARYAVNLSWVALATVVVMSIAFYLMFQKLVYRRLETLLGVMETAKAGNLDIEIENGGRTDEFTILTGNFNSMMRQIREMTRERERQNNILQEKVAQATGELVRKNEQLEEANVELFAASRKMSEMARLSAAGQTAAQFAHEVGTPLNLIGGHAQLLKAKLDDDSSEAKRLNLIAEQIERIEAIVRAMLDRTRFGEMPREPLDVNRLLRKIFDTVEPTLEERKVEMRFELAENLPPVSGNADRLQQVFINLINNALDAMPSGGEIFVSTAASASAEAADTIEVVFADTGCGLDEETRQRMFQPLFTTKRRGRGTGLGLSVVREILQEHDAEIRVESEPQAGAKFILAFPPASEKKSSAAERRRERG